MEGLKRIEITYERPKPVQFDVLVWRLAVKSGPPGDSYTYRGYWNSWHLVVRVVPSGDVCRTMDYKTLDT